MSEKTPRTLWNKGFWVRSVSCDLDHQIPYDPDGPSGQTRPDNLAALCRRHHRAKTARVWSYIRTPEGHERGLPVDKLYLHGAGWQTHLEDLGRSLAEATGAHPERWTEQTPAPAWRRRWDELSPAYEAMEIG